MIALNTISHLNELSLGQEVRIKHHFWEDSVDYRFAGTDREYGIFELVSEDRSITRDKGLLRLFEGPEFSQLLDNGSNIRSYRIYLS